MINKKTLTALASTFCLSAVLFTYVCPFYYKQPLYTDLLRDIDRLNGQTDRLNRRADGLNAQVIDLQGQLNAAEEKLNEAKMIRYCEPNETVNDQQVWKDAATFVWTPNNSTNNAILLTGCYLQHRTDTGGIPRQFMYGLFVDGRELWTKRIYTFDNYTWSPTLTRELEPISPPYVMFPNQENYTITLRFMSDTLGLGVYVKNINIFLEVVDGMPSS